MRRVAELVALAAGVALVFTSTRLNAQLQPQVDCAQLAAFAGRVAEYRELGAELAKVIEKIRRDNPSAFAQRVMVREAERVYREARGVDEAAYEAYSRCQQYLGRIPVEG